MLIAFMIPMFLAFGAPAASRAVAEGQASQKRLETLLKEWEKAESAIKDVRKVIRRTDDDRSFGTKEVFRIEVIGKKPNLLRFEMKDAKGKPETTLACTPGTARQFIYQTHEERIYDLPDDYPGAPAKEDNWGGSLARELRLYYQWLCLGFDVGEFKEGYDLKLVKEDQNYAYIIATPRVANGSRWFPDPKEMEIKIALRKTDFQPRTVIVLEPNGNTSTWEFLDTKTNLTPPVTVEMIQANLPQGWKKVEQPKLSAVKQPSGKGGSDK
jgi:outer membrane lipoprotein-sorting protein